VGRPKFDKNDFLDAALAIACERGPLAVTVGSITERLGAPTGSFYHRFASRDVLLGELWLRTVIDFQQGIGEALDLGDALKAALHTPAWVRDHPGGARLLLLYHRDDFIQGEWPAGLLDAVAQQNRGAEAGIIRFAELIFGGAGADDVRRAQFLIAELPIGLVRQHVRRGEPPPPIVDELIRVTYSAVLNEYGR
jgi:AcrR family transcriptional regulator